MIRNKDEMPERTIVDLTGPEGNAFVLLGYAKQWAKQLEYSDEKINALLTKMKVSDYENLLKVLDNEFGKFVTFLR